MKKLTILLVMVLCFASTWAIVSTISKSEMPDPPADAVGHPNIGAPPTIYFNKLVDEFADGGDILQFEIATLGGNWNLIRKGIQNGKKRTEMVPIALVSGFFRFNGPVWYYVCDISTQTCTGNGVNFCNPNSQGTNCVCNGGSETCNFGMDASQLYDTEVLI